MLQYKIFRLAAYASCMANMATINILFSKRGRKENETDRDTFMRIVEMERKRGPCRIDHGEYGTFALE